MKIELHQIGKKFNKHWLFKQVDFVVPARQTIAITGFNGSGKSTLLQILLGYQLPSAGKITYELNGQPLSDEHFFKHAAFVAPYLELPEELTLSEVFQFHFSFKRLMPDTSFEQVVAEAGLAGSEHKLVKHFSSGMKQRLKLILAFYSMTEVLLLDEPTSNLDENGIAWYQQLLTRAHHLRTIVIASNQKYEYELSDAVLDITKRPV